MGVNNDNPCPVCDNVYSDYHGNSIFTCRGCGNIFNNESKEWENIGKTEVDPEDIDPEAMEIIRCLQCKCVWPAGHNYCPECGKALDGIDPEEENQTIFMKGRQCGKSYDEFLNKFYKEFSEDNKIPIDILNGEFSPKYIQYSGRMRWNKSDKRNILLDESIPECTECDNPNPEECRICLETFEASRPKTLNQGVDFEQLYYNQMKIYAKAFTDNINLRGENDSLKKLFIETYKETIEYKKSIALHKSRETNLLKDVKYLKEQNKAFQEQYNTSGVIINSLRSNIDSLCSSLKMDYGTVDGKDLYFKELRKNVLSSAVADEIEMIYSKWISKELENVK